MAASSAMQSLLVSPVTGLANRSKVIQFSPVKSVPRLQRNANLQVRCLADVKFSSSCFLTSQISKGGIPLFLGTSIVLSLASLMPLFRGVTTESRPEGFMTSDAELWSGRLAMLGLVPLAFTEYVKGGTLI